MVRTAVVPCFPSAAGLPGLETLGFESFWRRFRAEAAPAMWLGVVLAAALVQVTPIVTVGRPALAGWLSAATLERHLQRLLASRVYLVRQSIFLLKMVGGLCWGAHPEIRARIGLDPYPGDPGTWRSA